jgi:LemA protein
MKNMRFIAPVIGVLVIVVGYGACKYNSLVNAEESADEAYANIETNLQRRADLIPNLVETVKGFAAQETEIFTEVANARSRLIGAKGSPAEAAAANDGMSSALSRLLAISERYPDLKSNANFMALQDELAGTENRINVARTRYNEAVASYNKTIRRFPSSLFASMFGFERKQLFEAEASAKEVPKVKF